jgi:hypothetical protein
MVAFTIELRVPVLKYAGFYCANFLLGLQIRISAMTQQSDTNVFGPVRRKTEKK